jgi:hypothetical protein
MVEALLTSKVTLLLNPYLPGYSSRTLIDVAAIEAESEPALSHVVAVCTFGTAMEKIVLLVSTL